MNQEKNFTSNLGDEWFTRNKKKISQKNVEKSFIISAIKEMKIKPKKILEIGCSNGSQLNLLQKEFKCECFGIDPSMKAINNGRKQFSNINFVHSTADCITFDDNSFDMVIFGFCLYLCSRNKLFRIAYEADRVLTNNGNLIINDFFSKIPFRNKYTHADKLFSYKMNYSNMFLWHPAYTLNYHINTSLSRGFTYHPDNAISVSILKKEAKYSFPNNPFKSKTENFNN